jgi:hypothetical protein
MTFLRPIWDWLVAVSGARDETGAWYGFWSGFAGSNIFLAGGLLTLYWRHCCHVHRCLRIGRHHVTGTPWVTCRKHHPAINGSKVTAQHIADAHEQAK